MSWKEIREKHQQYQQSPVGPARAFSTELPIKCPVEDREEEVHDLCFALANAALFILFGKACSLVIKIEPARSSVIPRARSRSG